MLKLRRIMNEHVILSQFALSAKRHLSANFIRTLFDISEISKAGKQKDTTEKQMCTKKHTVNAQRTQIMK